MASQFWDRNRSPKAQREIARIAAAAGLDPKAVNILFNTYFDEDDPASGWVQRPRTPGDAFAFARAAGVMADPVALDHGGVVAWLVDARDRLDRRLVADAFLASLRSRRMELRSALGSYAVFLHMRPHPYDPSGRRCRVCGIEGAGRRTVDRNASAFVRLKWAGGVNHSSPDYAARDLSLLADRPPPAARAEDRQVLSAVLDAVRGLPADSELAELQRALIGLFGSNKVERQLVLEILGYCGILQPRGRPSLRELFVPFDDREGDGPGKVWKREWHWPVQHWTGRDGVNDAAVRFWFPGLFGRRPSVGRDDGST